MEIKENVIHYAVNRIIDSVWTLTFEVVDGRIRVLSYDRDNPVGYEKERELPVCTLKEDKTRTIKEVSLSFGDWSMICKVINPQHIFSYE